MTRRTARSAVLAVLVPLALLAGCGGSDDSDSTASSDTSSEAPADDSDSSSDEPDEAPDMCELLTPAEVGAILGATVTAEESPIGGCDYKQEDPRASSVNIGAMLESDLGGGFDVYQSGTSQVLENATVSDPGVGEQSFIAAGTVAGLGAHQVAAAALGSNGVVVTINFSQPSAMDDATAVDQVEALLALANSKI